MTKYGAKKTEVDGISFDSKLEARYYLHLKEKKRNGDIRHFTLQPSYLLQEAFKDDTGQSIRKIEYIADFLITHNDGKVEVVDVKGMETSDFRIKKKMFLYKYPHLKLSVIKYVAKYGGWIEIDEWKKIKRREKKK